jgi:outer membrane lipoprotein SlyB
MKNLLLAMLAALVALAGCQLDEPTLGGTILSVAEAERGESPREESPKHYEDPLVPEVAWQVEVRLDGGRDVTVIHSGSRRYAPGDRVRLLVDEDGALLL